MNFGFIAHPTTTALKRHVKMIDLTDRLVKEQENGYERDLWRYRNQVPFVDFEEVSSVTGAACSGILHYFPYTAEEIVKNMRDSQRRVVKAIENLQAEGAEIVGLGGATSIIGGRGGQTAKQVAVPVTSGNSLTAFAGYRAFMYVVERLDLEPHDTRVAVCGYPGSISLAIAKLLLEQGFMLDLVYRKGAQARGDLLAYLDQGYHQQVNLLDDVASCYDRDRLFVTATSSGGIIDADKLKPGSVVVDIALPQDVVKPSRPRFDILLIDGGYVSAKDGVSMGTTAVGLSPTRQVNGCLAETMILALEGREESFSIGRELPLTRVLEIGEIAARHGFSTSSPASYGEPIKDEEILALKQYHRKASHSSVSSMESLHHDTAQRFRQHVNPVQADFLSLNHIDQVFVKARGCKLTDTHGTEYLDFVAGYGCLNLGHNHPTVASRLQTCLSEQVPTFVQYVSMPVQTSLLAERLCGLTSGNLSRVFFSNSGAEAVEASLKQARAATGRTQIVYTKNSYHGKTLGSLSVTGRERHRQHFYPLIPDCVEVPFGDLGTLRGALSNGNVAAFIVEPIQGEGGVILPPEGYLQAAQRLCNETGTLFIVDEIQTGLGRTGELFACDHEGISPDILCLSKSLSGGLIPIGATLSTQEVWDAAYGSASRFALHTSTFGGNNLAGVAGLATLDVLIEEDLASHAASIGLFLREGLRQIADRYPFVKEVRGRGMMNAIEFDNSFAGAFRATAEEFATRLPGDLHRLYSLMPDDAREHLRLGSQRIEDTLEDLFCLRFVTKLARDHKILTFLTANHNKVMRIQPPLVLSHDEAQRFIDAFAEVCQDLSTFASVEVAGG